MSDPVAGALDLVRRHCEACVPEDIRHEVLIDTAAAADVARLLGVLDEDPYSLFWG